jgi:hypothetical protein
MFSSCAIHKEFPYICFLPSCVFGHIDFKPLKKRMQIAVKGKKRKFNSSISSSKSKRNKSNYTSDYDSNKLSPRDSTITDSITDKSIGLSLTSMDTVIRIYYLDLSDSTLIKNKSLIKSFIIRIGINKISEISLSDFYSNEDPDKHKSESIKAVIGKYLVDVGVSKHRLFWRKNKRLKSSGLSNKYKNLVYLEIRFN